MNRKIIFVLLLLFLVGCSAKGNLKVEVGGVLGFLEEAEIEISKVEIGGVDYGSVVLKGNEALSLSTKEINPGRYNLIKIYWGKGQIVKSGETFFLEMPSEPTLVTQNFLVNEGDNFLRINIDLDSSSVKAGPGVYRFKPVIGINQNI